MQRRKKTKRRLPIPAARVALEFANQNLRIVLTVIERLAA
jgi:hypothetical protein